MTVFSCQSFGRGRTFAMATDSTFAWGTDFEKSWGEGDNRYFRKFWRNVVRWLTENSEGSNRRLKVETDRIIYRPGQEIQIKARTYDEKLVDTDRYRVAARLGLSADDEPTAFRRGGCQPRSSTSREVLPGQGCRRPRRARSPIIWARPFKSWCSRSRRLTANNWWPDPTSISRSSTIRPSFETPGRIPPHSPGLPRQQAEA